jgi:hypothetical protein
VLVTQGVEVAARWAVVLAALAAFASFSTQLLHRAVESELNGSRVGPAGVQAICDSLGSEQIDALLHK